jgi:DNA-binding transcriptional LysR family regulator
MVLTPDGELVLSYANSILRLHDELLSRLETPDVEGQVVLGTPDLYASFMLPSILARFKQAFPRVQVQLQCSLSTPLVRLVHRGEVDLALVTRMNDFSGGKVVRQEQLIWMTGENSAAHAETPVPLALLPPGNIYRDHAIECLEAAWRPWRIACVSESVSGLQAAVFSGMAVTVLGRSALVQGMREIAHGADFPALPKVDLLLYKAPGTKSAAANALHDYLAHYLQIEGSTDLRNAPRPPPSHDQYAANCD